MPAGRGRPPGRGRRTARCSALGAAQGGLGEVAQRLLQPGILDPGDHLGDALMLDGGEIAQLRQAATTERQQQRREQRRQREIAQLRQELEPEPGAKKGKAGDAVGEGQ